MLRILDKSEQKYISFQEAEELYAGCNYLLIDTIHENGVMSGTIYAISEEPATLSELVSVEGEMQSQEHHAFVGGDYYPNCMYDYLQIVGEQL